MSSLNGVTYICSAGLSSVTSAGTLGPYFALTYFLPAYDFRIDKTICDTSAISISSLNYTSATHSSLSSVEIIYNNPELSGQGSYDILNFNSMYSKGTIGSGPAFSNTLQKTGDNKINVLNGKVLQPQVSAVGFSNIAPGSLSAMGSYATLAGSSVNYWNPLSGTSTNWPFQNLFRVTSYSPNQSTSGIASGNYKCRIPAGAGSFKFNMLAIYATRVNQYGYADPGVVGSPYNPTLFAIVVFDTPQVKSDTVGSLNAFEANVELTFGLASAAATPVYINTDYFTRIPTSNTTSAYALNYDGDVVISSSATPGSWVPRAKLTITDSEKDQVRLAHDETRYTTISTERFKPYSTYTTDQEMAVLDIDTSCPDDALLQLGYNCVSTGIKSIAMGCYSSATGYEDSYAKEFVQSNPDIGTLYYSQRGGYTVAIGVENISQGLLTTSIGYQTSAIGYGSFAGGFASIASSNGNLSDTYNGSPSEGLNFAFGFRTSAIGDGDNQLTLNSSSLSPWFWASNGNIVGGNAAFNTLTLAKGNACVAFNIGSTAYGTGNTSFGMNTSALNILTIATGLNTIADGILSQAHGQYTSANAILSYVFGGLAQADVNAHGSLTFGSPYIYGTGSGSTGIYFPGYNKSILNGSTVQTVSIATPPELIDKYIKTYNDGMGAFVFGQGTSAYSQALQSFVVGICNKTSSQGSTIFGNSNDVSTNSGFSSVIGGKNTIADSQFSNTQGFLNALVSSNSSFVRGIANSATSSNSSYVDGINNLTSSSNTTYVIGSDNILTSADYSSVTGIRNTLRNTQYTNIVGNNNSIPAGVYVGVLGNNTYVENAINSFAIGNNVQITNAANSVAIGYRSQISASNSIQVGSCAISSVNIQASNIMLDAKECSNNSTITLRANKIELDGYTGNIERYKFDLAYGRERSTTPYSSWMKIKLLRLRCDQISGKVDSIYIKIAVDTNNKYVCHRITNTNSSSELIGSFDVITCVMVNPTTSSPDWYFGTDNSKIDEYLSKGYRLLVKAETNILFDYSVNFYAINELVKMDIYTYSNDSPKGNVDYLIGSGYNDLQTLTSNSTLKFVARGTTKKTDGAASDSQIQFISRSGDGSLRMNNSDSNILMRGATATLVNGLVVPSLISTPEELNDAFMTITDEMKNAFLVQVNGWNDALLI